MGPDEALFREHLESDVFQAGVTRGEWRLEGGLDSTVWPNPIFWIQSDARFVSSGGLHIRLDLQQYSEKAPTGCPWDHETNARLENAKWPKGGGNVSRVFNPGWNASAIYAPCDRVAMSGHESAWKTKFSAWWWTSSFTFVRYLEFVHITLNPPCARP